jgi:tRNA uridine 5-carboxymethylaminomethyl modification enzyme
MYDCVVIGGGHAGCEAALSTSRLGLNTLLVSTKLDMIASMPCNPSIGGPAKGIVVREIDALGGEMGVNADKTYIQIKVLNSSKGPAVRALRCQSDKLVYPKEMLKTLLAQENLTVIEDLAYDILVDENKKVSGVVLKSGKTIECKSIIVCTGTYMRSKILVGKTATERACDNQETTSRLSDSLKGLGFDIIRLKTGTPPRIKKDSIDYSKTKLESGDTNKSFFNHFNKELNILNVDVPCHLTYTTDETLNIIRDNLLESSMYSGLVEGVGPRYCPSIEDKVVRFSDKERHQIFLEPESLSLDEIYVQGFSTSMPHHIQEKMVKSVQGLENASIVKYAYAIEYDAINPTILYPTLETKLVENLYFAGQINGTSGYEEAACQGLMAGINCYNKLNNKEPFIVKRNEAYIGVLIDDLVTKGIKDPYRLLTSRSEFRLLLRNDNADLRLCDKGHEIGLLPDEKYNKYLEKVRLINEAFELYKNSKIVCNEENNNYLESIGSARLEFSVNALDLQKRPEVSYLDMKKLLNIDYNDEILEQVEIQVKYQGYIEKAYKEAKKLEKIDNYHIPEDIEYDIIQNLASEAKDKLKKIKPFTLGQASRISGVNPSDISILMIYLEGLKKEKKHE